MHNTVELIGFYGGDTTHAQSAWTSTSRELTDEKKGRIESLLNMLARDGHHTPFEKSMLHFLVNTDIATHIHLLKHRISVPVNAESARYKELKEDKVYLPEDWRDIPLSEEMQQRALKGTYETAALVTGCKDWSTVLYEYAQLGNYLYHMAIQELTPVLGRKRAKESARFFKTYNSQIAADISFNWRSFMHFQKLRNDEHAQKEVRELAQEMLRLVQDIPGNPFELSLKSFGYDR